MSDAFAQLEALRRAGHTYMLTGFEDRIHLRVKRYPTDEFTIGGHFVIADTIEECVGQVLDLMHQDGRAPPVQYLPNPLRSFWRRKAA